MTSLFSRLQKLNKEAALAPWRWNDEELVPGDEWPNGSEPVYVRSLGSPGRFVLSHATYWRIRDQEAELIAECRNSLPAVLNLIEAAKLPDGVGHWFRGSVHWFDPSSTPMPGCPLCAAVAVFVSGQEEPA